MSKPIAYWQTITGKRVLIIGPMPPPMGGVAVHVERVAHFLRTHGNAVMVHHSEPRGRSLLFNLYAARLQRILTKFRPTDIHYHGTYLPNSDRELKLLGTMLQQHAIELSIIEHDCRHLYARSADYSSWYKNFIEQYNVNLMLVGTKTVQSYLDLQMPCQRAVHAHAFLPPLEERLPHLLATYPPQLWQHIQRSSPLLMMNAFACVRHNDTDLYGIRDAIQATLALRKDHPTIGLCIIMATIGDAGYMHTLYALARQTPGAIFFLIGNYQLWPLLPHADIFIRPTYSDGDSVSVREALWANIPVIATNVCARPDGVSTYDPLQPDALRALVTSLSKR
jgi:glycosyltransferase involved in cell wall biosynthesis